MHRFRHARANRPVWACLALLLLASAGPAQAPSGWEPFKLAGQALASRYGAWSLAVRGRTGAGLGTLQVAGDQATLAGGRVLPVLQVGDPVELVDSQGGNEIVTPMTVICPSHSGGACELTAMFALAHQCNCSLTSASAGLGEAIHDLPQGGVVVLTPDWQGTTAMLLAASLPPGVLIHDVRVGQAAWYTSHDGQVQLLAQLAPAPSLPTLSSANLEGIRFTDQYPGASAGAQADAAAAQVDPAQAALLIMPASSGGGSPSATAANLDWLDLRTGTPAQPEANRLFAFPSFGLNLWDNSALSTDPSAQLDNHAAPLVRYIVHGSGSGNPVPLYLDAELNSPAAASINAEALLSMCNLSSSDTHLGCWGSNFGAGKANPAVNQTLFGSEVNVFNNTGLDDGLPNPNGTYLHGPDFGYAATSNGNAGLTAAFLADSNPVTSSPPWHIGFYALGVSDVGLQCGVTTPAALQPMQCLVAAPQGTATANANFDSTALRLQSAWWQSALATAEVGNISLTAHTPLGANSLGQLQACFSGFYAQAGTACFPFLDQNGKITANQWELSASGTIDSGAVLSNQGTITGGAIEAASLSQGGAPVALTAQLPGSGSILTTAVAVETVAIVWPDGQSRIPDHCILGPTDASAASNLSTSFISSKAANQIALSHAAVAGMSFDVVCTAN